MSQSAKAFIIILVLLVVGCASTIEEKMFSEAKENFTYKADVADEWLRYDSISEAFTGDCEDFAFTLQHAIGGRVMFTASRSGPHAVLEKDGIIYDNLNYYPQRLQEYPAKLLYEMTYKTNQ